MTLTLAVEKREKTGSAASADVREQGRVPATVYGRTHTAMSVSVDAALFGKVYREAGESTVVTLTGTGEDIETLISEVTTDPVRGSFLHVDFYAVEKGKKVEVDVPLHFDGVSPAEKELGGTLIKVMHELSIEALPKDLPHEIVVDVSSLKTFDDQILVRDITLPAGVTAVVDGEEVVALVQAAQEETEETASADLSSIEVEKKGKEEEQE